MNLNLSKFIVTQVCNQFNAKKGDIIKLICYSENNNVDAFLNDKIVDIPLKLSNFKEIMFNKFKNMYGKDFNSIEMLIDAQTKKILIYTMDNH